MIENDCTTTEQRIGPISGGMPEQEFPVVPTEAQLSAAKACGFLRKMEILSCLAANYTSWKSAEARRSGKAIESPSEMRQLALDALCRIYFSSSNPEDSYSIRKDDESDGDAFSGLLERAQLPLASTNEIFGEAASLTKMDRAGIMLKSVLFLTGKSPLDQKQKLLEMMGYDSGTISRLGESAKLTLKYVATGDVALFLSQYLPVFMQAPIGLNHPAASAAIGTAYAIDAAALAYNTREILKCLHNPDLEVSPNLYVTLIYLLSRKLLPDHPKLQDVAAVIMSVAPTIVSEVGLYPQLYLLDNGVSVTIFRNILSAANQIIQGLVARRMDENLYTSPS